MIKKDAPAGRLYKIKSLYCLNLSALPFLRMVDYGSVKSIEMDIRLDKSILFFHNKSFGDFIVPALLLFIKANPKESNEDSQGADDVAEISEEDIFPRKFIFSVGGDDFYFEYHFAGSGIKEFPK